MRRYSSRLCALALVVAACAAAAEAQSARLTVEELLKIQRVGDPQLSPDGKWVAYTVAVPDLAANRSRTQIYRVAVAGGEPNRLTEGPPRPRRRAGRPTDARSPT